MHEMSLAESILQIIEDTAQAEGYAKVKWVCLESCLLPKVKREALRFCFDVVIHDSIAGGARLEIVETPGQGWCMKCACSVTVTALYDPCPTCGSHQIQVTAGNEMRVRELEVE